MPARRTAVRELVSAAKVAILYVQETKLASIIDAIALEVAGPERCDYAFLPADGTRGGVAIFWDASIVSLSNIVVRRYSITASVRMLLSDTTFSLSTVYGPCNEVDKALFLSEMLLAKPPQGSPWLILGDFNLIYEARDKSNQNLCRRLMGQFRKAINAAELMELRCSNRHLSWSNERDPPTQVYLDRIFCNLARDVIFATCSVQALSTSHSDHCLMLLSPHSSDPLLGEIPV
jgi:exonuclease III